jgi:hypothetical protein
MSTDLRLALPNRPGTLAQACAALTKAGVAIEGVSGDLRPGDRWGYLHFLVDDADAAKAALEAVGVEVSSAHHVETSHVDGGADHILGAISRYTEEDRNVEVLYLTHDGRLVVGTEDMRQERPGVNIQDAKY